MLCNLGLQKRKIMKQKILKIIFIFFISLFTNYTQCITIGSDSSVDKFSTQQILNNGDRIACFASLAGGFRLATSSTTATFDSTFPVSGTVALEKGTLSLDNNLIFNETSIIQTLGDIIGNNHKLELSSNITNIPESTSNNGSAACNISQLTNSAQSSIVYSCDWSYDDTFVAIGLANSSYNNLKIYAFNNPTLTFKDSELLSNASVGDISWHPSKHLLAAITSSRTGNDFFVYEVNPTTGALTFKSGIDLFASGYAIDWHPSGNFIAVGKSTSTQEIAIYEVDAQGNINATPVATYNTDAAVSSRALCWNNDGTYLAIGLSSYAVNELLVLAFNQETETLSFDCAKNLCYSVLSVAWSKISPQFLAVGLAIYYGADGLRIYEFDPDLSILTQRATKTVDDYVRALDWSPTSNCLIAGRDSDAAGKEVQCYYFDSSDYSLNLMTDFEIGYYMWCLKWSHNGAYVAQASSNQSLYIYSCPNCLSENSGNFDITNLNIFLNSDISLKYSTITFKGESSIIGQDHILSLDPTGIIAVGSNSSLLLKNIIITGIQNNNILLTDNTSTVTLQNVTWILENDFSINNGTLDIKDCCEIYGQSYTFSYQTSGQTTICENSKLILQDDTTLYYDPPTASNDLIQLNASTSQLVLNGATLQTTSTGLQLTKGILAIDNNSSLVNGGTVAGEAIIFGDGINEENNISIQHTPAACLNITSGIVIDKNV